MERGYTSLAPAGVPVTHLIALDGVGVFGSPVPDKVATSCQALAKEENAWMLGVDVHQDGAGDWFFGNATPTPWLEAGGDALLDGLATLLKTTLTSTEKTGDSR
jgi:hypothetical protein